MSFYRSFGWVLSGCLAINAAGFVHAAEAKIGTEARWANYAATGDEAFFALSLKADLGALVPSTTPRLVVLVDTSASQTGESRIDSLAILKSLVEALPSDSEICIAACDVDTHDLSNGLQKPVADEIRSAIAKLESRLPLGTTDLEAALRFGGKLLQGKSDASIVYIGDGIARSHILNRDEFKGLVQSLVDNRVSVTSLGIGPMVNVEGLATLANHTGGMVLVRRNTQASTQQIGQALARAAAQPVFWVEEGALPDSLVEHFPKKIPPIRADRDSILLGVESTPSDMQTSKVTLKGSLAGVSRTIEWSVTKEKSNVDFAFLPTVISKAKADGGLYLPTAGSEALRGLSVEFSDSASRLVDSGRFAFQSGDLTGALSIAEEALARDPNNLEARDLRDTVRQKLEAASLPKKAKFIQAPFGDDPFGTGVPVPEVASPPVVAPPLPNEPLPPMAQPAPIAEVPSFPSAPVSPPTAGYAVPSTDGLSELATAGDMLAREGELRRLKASQFETAARVRIQEAESALGRDPIAAEGSLKLLLSDIRRAPELERAFELDWKRWFEATLRQRVGKWRSIVSKLRGPKKLLRMPLRPSEFFPKLHGPNPPFSSLSNASMP